MTLILSQVSKDGIAMAADCAVTERFPPEWDWTLASGAMVPDTIRTGAQKLVPIDAIDAAVSVWGCGTVGTLDCPNAWVPIDKFLRDFAENMVSDGESLEEVGTRLACLVNKRMGDNRDPMGFHLAGYVEQKGRRFPALYHIHRGHRDELPEPLKLYRDWPFESMTKTGKSLDEALAYIDGGGFVWLRNGDFKVYAVFAEYLNCLMNRLQKEMDFICPHYKERRFRDELEARGRYLKVQIETICEFYRLSNRDETIAKPVSWLTISPCGIQDCELVEI